MCDGKLNGAEIGSKEVTFSPGALKGGHFEARVKTAGYVSILFYQYLSLT